MSNLSAVAVVIGSVALTGGLAHATSQNGGPSFFTGGPASGGNSCILCHADGPMNGSVQLLGLPNGYTPDSVYDLTVRVSDPDQAGAGFAISAEDSQGAFLGTLLISDQTNTQFADGSPNFVTHSETGVINGVANWAANGNAAEFNLQWQAPASDVGEVTFWVVGNAINDNNNFQGDFVYGVSETITAVQTAPCPADTDGDGSVNVTDLVNVILEWDCVGACLADVTDDGVVNVSDLLEVILQWGACP